MQKKKHNRYVAINAYNTNSTELRTLGILTTYIINIQRSKCTLILGIYNSLNTF